MSTNKRKINRLLADLKPLKKVEGNLPYYFDLTWDCKTVEDIIRFGLQNNKSVQMKLAEYGYDVKGWISDNTNQVG